MSLVSDIKRQFGWRDWPRVFDALPPLAGQTVLDLGCGLGDIAAALAARGARVVGVDLNESLLAEAWSRNLANAEFHLGDLREPPDVGLEFDGVWCSFAAAYFPELAAPLATWRAKLRLGGWIALTEIDDFFGHKPLGARARAQLDAYAADALAAKRYDFHMGRKLSRFLERGGFANVRLFDLADKELAFDGPAHVEVVDAWRSRLDRMVFLRNFCGAEFEDVRDAFLACLARDDHRSTARVVCCIAANEPPRRDAKG